MADGAVRAEVPVRSSIQWVGATAQDFEDLLALRLRAMRESLSRLGRYDEARSRERLASGFDPGSTFHIEADGRRVGFVVLKRLSHALRIDHLYVDPPNQGQGIGSKTLQWVFAQADRELLPVELCVLKESAANRFYLHHGFAQVGEGEWDIDYVRVPLTVNVRAVQRWWTALQARDWVRARDCLHPEVEARWWTSGERFSGADALVQVNANYPEGWTIHLLEVEHLEDGRVMSIARVDHPPHSFFANSFFRLDDGRITALDEYWATVEEPPAWRKAAALPGVSRFDPADDARAVLP